MKGIPFFKRLKEDFIATMLCLACVFLIALLMGACASSDYSKQTSTHSDDTAQVSAKGETKDAETDDSQKIECRNTRKSGSRLKSKTCLPKWQWALIDEERKEGSDRFVRDVEQDSRRSIDSGIDRVGGQSTGPPH